MLSKVNFCWPKDAFKNFYCFFATALCFWYMYHQPDSRGEMLILLTLIFKHYFDNSPAFNKQADTINSMANSIPDAEKK